MYFVTTSVLNEPPLPAYRHTRTLCVPSLHRPLGRFLHLQFKSIALQTHNAHSHSRTNPRPLPHHVIVHSCTTTFRMVACPSQPALTACTRCIHTDGYPPQYYPNHSPDGTPMHNIQRRSRDVRTELIFKHSANAVAPFGPTAFPVRMCVDVGERMKRPAFSTPARLWNIYHSQSSTAPPVHTTPSVCMYTSPTALPSAHRTALQSHDGGEGAAARAFGRISVTINSHYTPYPSISSPPPPPHPLPLAHYARLTSHGTDLNGVIYRGACKMVSPAEQSAATPFGAPPAPHTPRNTCSQKCIPSREAGTQHSLGPVPHVLRSTIAPADAPLPPIKCIRKYYPHTQRVPTVDCHQFVRQQIPTASDAHGYALPLYFSTCHGSPVPYPN